MSNSTPDFLSLSISERIPLVEDIWDSITSEAPGSVGLSTAQRAELQRRVAAHDADPSTAVEWDVVCSELLQRDH
jgi:putative addiction module component (TIGR02574 family)